MVATIFCHLQTGSKLLATQQQNLVAIGGSDGSISNDANPSFTKDWRDKTTSSALSDPFGLINSSLNGKVRRAIDIRQAERPNEQASLDLVRAAVALNQNASER